MPKIESKKSEITPQQKLASELLEQFKATFIKVAQVHHNDPIGVTRMGVVALSQLAAVLAVDAGMQSDQFVNVCRCNFEEAFKVAPRFA